MIAPTDQAVETAPQDMRLVMIDTLTRAVERGENIAVVVGDSTTTSKIKPFGEAYPDRVINVGIAEQNVVGVATGLALGGYVAFTCNAAPFLISRSNEQIKNDVCYSNTNVKLVGLNAGFAYSNLGSTHHAIDDLSIMRGFGNIQILAPADPVEAGQIFEYAIRHEGPVYIRMDSAKLRYLHGKDYRFEPGNVDMLREGNDITMCVIGSLAVEAVDAAERLARQGISAEVLNISSLRPLDKLAVVRSLSKTGRVVTVEEHSVCGGLGSTIAEIIAESGMPVRLKRLGIAEGHFAKAGPRAEVRAWHGIDAEGIVKEVTSG